MELYINRYFKDDKKGYRFLSEKDFFADAVIRSSIEKGILSEIIGNRSVSAWVGGVIFDFRKTPYYVFGHNEMIAQEKGSSRLSSRYTFIVVPFDNLFMIGSMTGLMREITMYEELNSFKSDIISYHSNGICSAEWMESKVVDALSTYLVDQDVQLEMRDSPESCKAAIEFIWNRSVFPEKMPSVVYMDRSSQDKPQRGWVFQDFQGSEFQLSKSLRMRNNVPEQTYLYWVGKLVMGDQNQNFRKLFTPKHRQEFIEDVGRQNGNMLVHAMVWHFALHAGIVDALPTADEKQQLLRKMK